jgi:hypothetical protein
VPRPPLRRGHEALFFMAKDDQGSAAPLVAGLVDAVFTHPRPVMTGGAVGVSMMRLSGRLTA